MIIQCHKSRHKVRKRNEGYGVRNEGNEFCLNYFNLGHPNPGVDPQGHYNYQSKAYETSKRAGGAQTM